MRPNRATWGLDNVPQHLGNINRDVNYEDETRTSEGEESLSCFLSGECMAPAKVEISVRRLVPGTDVSNRTIRVIHCRIGVLYFGTMDNERGEKEEENKSGESHGDREGKVVVP